MISLSTVKNQVNSLTKGLGLLILLLTFSCKENKAPLIKFIESPIKGDIYEMKVRPKTGDVVDKLLEGKEFYTLYTIDSIGGSDVYFKTIELISSNSSDLAKFKLREDVTYSKVRQLRTKQSLLAMLNEGEILNIERK